MAVIAAATLLGASLEAYQSTLDGREASVYDALANLAGAAAGALVAIRLTWRLPP